MTAHDRCTESLFSNGQNKNSKDCKFEEWNDLKQSANELCLYSLQQKNPLIEWMVWKGLSELICQVYIKRREISVREIQSCN